jgi:hypothetical protein
VRSCVRSGVRKKRCEEVGWGSGVREEWCEEAG